MVLVGRYLPVHAQRAAADDASEAQMDQSWLTTCTYVTQVMTNHLSLCLFTINPRFAVFRVEATRRQHRHITMAKKKNKQASHLPVNLIRHSTHFVFEKVLRPWCWYCEREFEDEKGLFDSHLSPSLSH